VTGAEDTPLATLLLSPPFLAVLGLAIGSFLNVVIHRLPILMEREWWRDLADQLRDPDAWKRSFPQAAAQTAAGDVIDAELGKLAPLSLARPRSRCPACGHQLAWHENLPLLGWLRLRGRCSACGTRISVRYPAVEATTALLFAACGAAFGPTAAAAVWCVACALLVAMTMIDIDTQYLPDDLTIPLIGLGLLGAGLGWTGVTMEDAAWGAFWGFAGLWGVNRLYRAVRGHDGIGAGDFKLLAGLGALLGWKLLPAIVLLSSVVGALVGIALIGARRLGWTKPIPFGPYLAGGGLAAAFFGGPLTALYFPGA
jgi:leader peptidase (prepilin peptidase)/N-methyltransferase